MGLVTQQDPIGIAGGLNLYGYANGDPINFSDPFRLCGVAGAVASFAIGAGIALAAGTGYSLATAAFDAGSGALCLGMLGKLRRGRGVAQVTRNRLQGQAFEEALGITGPKQAIPSLTGTATRRFPDELTTTYIREAKSGMNVRFDAQIEDYLRFAEDRQLDFILDVRKGASIDPRLRELEEAGRLLIREH